MNLSANFALDELLFSQQFIRLGIKNTPLPVHLESMKALCTNLLQPLRGLLGRPINVNSGYRCPELNSAFHGSSKSQHCLGEAVDFTVAGMSCLGVCRFR